MPQLCWSWCIIWCAKANSASASLAVLRGWIHAVRPGQRAISRAIAELGLPGGRIVSFGHVPITMRQGRQAKVQMLEQWPDTDAVICVSALSAFGAVMECQRRGWAVPSRVTVACFGNFEVARYSYPSITAVEAEGRAIDILVNNAGVQHRTPLESFDPMAWDRLFRTNVDSVFNVGQAVARQCFWRPRHQVLSMGTFCMSMAVSQPAYKEQG